MCVCGCVCVGVEALIHRSSPPTQCQLEVPRATTLEALRLARKHGVESILNPAPAAENLEPVRREFKPVVVAPATRIIEPPTHTQTQEMLALPSILCPNETELSLLCGGLPVATDAEIRTAARNLLSRVGEDASVLVTLGAKGALLLDRVSHAEGTLIPCPAVESVVDTSGAGDCFLGALAAYRSAGLPLEAAVGKAGRVASMSVQRAGTQPSYPQVEELPEELRLPSSS